MPRGINRIPSIHGREHVKAMGCTVNGMIRRSGEEPDDIERADITDGHVTIRRARIVFAADDDIRRTVSGHHGTRALADAIIGLLDRE